MTASANLDQRLKKYQEKRKKDGWETFSKANYVTRANVALTLLFEMFCALVVWYVLLLIWNGKMREEREIDVDQGVCRSETLPGGRATAVSINDPRVTS